LRPDAPERERILELAGELVAMTAPRRPERQLPEEEEG